MQASDHSFDKDLLLSTFVFSGRKLSEDVISAGAEVNRELSPVNNYRRHDVGWRSFFSGSWIDRKWQMTQQPRPGERFFRDITADESEVVSAQYEAAELTFK